MSVALLLVVLGLLLCFAGTMYLGTRVPGSDPLAVAAGVACLILALTLAVTARLPQEAADGDGRRRPEREPTVEKLEHDLRRLQRRRWSVLRETYRFWVVVALIGWMIVVGIPIIFQGGNVSAILSSPGAGVSSGSAGWPWAQIWVVGCLVILAIGFLTRKRA